tara:strand:- start:9854 stop:10018 length:165 start_codon:yes stop_codon:yes gene_type:complete
MNNIEKALEHAKRASELVGGTFSYLHTGDQARNYGKKIVIEWADDDYSKIPSRY